MNLPPTLRPLAAVACVAAALAHAPATQAAVVLQYTGLAYNEFIVHPNSNGSFPRFDSDDRSLISLTLDAPLAANLSNAAVTPLAFTATNGMHTFTKADVTTSNFRFWTDAQGFISQWRVEVTRQVSLTLFTFSTIRAADPRPVELDVGGEVLCGPISIPGSSCVLGGNPFYSTVGRRMDQAGTWQGDGLVQRVPEPSTLLLAALPLGWLARRALQGTVGPYRASLS